MGEYTGKSYQPSNGTEGMWFEDEFCMRCVNCDPDPSGPKQCAILCAALAFSIGEEHYPKEWVYDENDEPTCTAWKEWDWTKKGNPDDPQNEHYAQPEDPNQLSLFIDPSFPQHKNECSAEAEEMMGFEVEEETKKRTTE